MLKLTEEQHFKMATTAGARGRVTNGKIITNEDE
jgi:hypothetical protein